VAFEESGVSFGKKFDLVEIPDVQKLDGAGIGYTGGYFSV
jgi:hypothetical protein